MVVTDDVTLFAGVLEGKPQVGGVAVAEAKTITVVAAETGNVTRAAASSKAIPKQGIYEFPDAATGGGRIYVGQPSTMPNRLRQHTRNGRIAPGTSVTTQEILGGKLPRERAEQNRINQLGGTRNQPGSRTSNIRNPIGRRRRDQSLPD